MIALRAAFLTLLIIVELGVSFGQGSGCIGRTNNACEVGCNCFRFAVSRTQQTSQGGVVRTFVSFNVTNYCDVRTQKIAIGTSGLDVDSPLNNQWINGLVSRYKAQHVSSGWPRFPAIRYTLTGPSQLRNGATERFNLTIDGPLDPRYTWSFAGKASPMEESFTGFSLEHCNCTNCYGGGGGRCPAGFRNPNCAQCDDGSDHPGWTWWCMPTHSQCNPWSLQLLHCNPNVNCPSGGFSPAITSTDPQGYNIRCNCTRDRVGCPNNCTGNGICNEATGVCNCQRGTGPTCAGGNYTCPHHCSGRGICVNGVCQCVSPYTGLDCSQIYYTSCADYDTCGECNTAPANLRCSWCAAGGVPNCRANCSASFQIPFCSTTPSFIMPEFICDDEDDEFCENGGGNGGLIAGLVIGFGALGAAAGTIYVLHKKKKLPKKFKTPSIKHFLPVRSRSPSAVSGGIPLPGMVEM